MRPWVDAALRRTPAQPAFHWRASRRLAVLAYHSVDDPERFSQQVAHLRRRMHPVSLDDVMAASRGRHALPRGAVLVTFDDADRTIADAAMPQLRAAGIPAVAFVVAGLLDSDRPVWTREAAALVANGGTSSAAPDRDPIAVVRRMKRLPDDERLAALEELRRTAMAPAPEAPQLGRADLPVLERAGVAIGNHSMSHPCLPRCSGTRIREEVERGRHALGKILGAGPRAFAYPNGDWDDRARRAVEEAGHDVGFLFDHRHSPVPPGDPLLVSRLWVNSTDRLDRFRIIVSGLQPAMYRARLRLRGAPASVPAPSA